MPMKMLQLNQHLPAIVGLRLRGTETNPLITGLACGGMGSTGPGRTLSNICSAISTSTSAAPPGMLRGDVLGCQAVRCVQTHTRCVWTHIQKVQTHTRVWTHTLCTDTHTRRHKPHQGQNRSPGGDPWREEHCSESRSGVSDSLQPHKRHSPWTLQARTLEQVAFPFSRGSSQPRDRTQVSGFCQILSEDGTGVRGQSPQMSPGSAW